MQKILMGFGIGFIVLLIAAGGFVAFTVYKGENLDKDSKQFVDASMPIILTDWDVNNFYNYIDQSQFEKHGINQDQVKNLLGVLKKKLGDLKQYKGSQGESNVVFNSKGRAISAHYVVEADFDKGPATMQLALTKNPDWKIIRLNVNSPVLLK